MLSMWCLGLICISFPLRNAHLTVFGTKMYGRNRIFKNLTPFFDLIRTYLFSKLSKHVYFEIGKFTKFLIFIIINYWFFNWRIWIVNKLMHYWAKNKNSIMLPKKREGKVQLGKKSSRRKKDRKVQFYIKLNFLNLSQIPIESIRKRRMWSVCGCAWMCNCVWVWMFINAISI